MIVVGLTGSIGMGKSTTARLFADAGAAVFDADAVVHALYRPGGAAVAPVEAAFAGVRDEAGGIDRAKLRARLQADPQAFAQLEAIVHPLVAEQRRAFVRRAKRRGAHVVVLDIPLLFEVGAQKGMDAIVVVSADAEIQRERVMARPGMTKAAFEAILARQVPDAVKRKNADFVVDTGRGVPHARAQVGHIMRVLRRRDERTSKGSRRDRGRGGRRGR